MLLGVLTQFCVFVLGVSSSLSRFIKKIFAASYTNKGRRKELIFVLFFNKKLNYTSLFVSFIACTYKLVYGIV